MTVHDTLCIAHTTYSWGAVDESETCEYDRAKWLRDVLREFAADGVRGYVSRQYWSQNWQPIGNEARAWIVGDTLADTFTDVATGEDTGDVVPLFYRREWNRLF
jgi:hypothetical protein